MGADDLSWAEAFELWLSGKSDNTKRAYRRAWEAFLAHSGKATGEVSRADVQAWVGALRADGLSDRSINQMAAAISSFYGVRPGDDGEKPGDGAQPAPAGEPV